VRILLSGLSGTGSTTAARRLATDFGLSYVYGGQIFRNLAVDRGISLEELAESLEHDQETEREIDRRLVAAGIADNVLIESRTIGWIFPRDSGGADLVTVRPERAAPAGASPGASPPIRRESPASRGERQPPLPGTLRHRG
jgi:cytidylate kinase